MLSLSSLTFPKMLTAMCECHKKLMKENTGNGFELNAMKDVAMITKRNIFKESDRIVILIVILYSGYLYLSSFLSVLMISVGCI